MLRHRASPIRGTGRGSGDVPWVARKPVAGGGRGRRRVGAPAPFALRRGRNDAILVAAERKCRELLARADAQLKINAAQRFREPTLNEIAKRVGTIYNTPPSTLIGAAVKLRMAIHPELGTEEDEGSEIVIALRQVLALVEREIAQTGRPLSA
jgi:hypothetical protein